ncbi:hypothetical protein I6J18_04885 [Peribacillus psychrosaccharolyticus]|uniref:Uncharacterized protein n=1 Tax=Peribacillus psychrosaccharolyticus TaxID=1407 RepID=A0A974S118_PERPY|nr:hypothetical protein [Peribacillus psychrosaccharolyticus]MEC2054140.1 hypothetical protein [Peribacillus psychrosaccharolyticus]MED3742242.1 hypothetical protein [Peribacillus psychrosaccharolyticus]QQT01227.1 hypothetical protein I6J18_04885 [Peribacillus psychrosaccharolyticus]
MQKKMNYLILLLTTIFMVGCTNVEDASITDGETDPQEVTTVNKNKKSEKEETITTVVNEPVVEETPTQPNNVIQVIELTFL